VSVRIRMKQFGRKHRPFYRICAMDIRKPRDGRVLEELGTYDPLVPETDARALLNAERINHWLSVGAKPSDTVQVLIKKYGAGGTHVEAQKLAIERLAIARRRPDPMPLMPRPPKPAKADEAPARGRKKAAAQAPAAEAPAADAPAADAPAAEPAAEAPAAE
jgi:small subunit ribosomal protein S16